MPTTARTQAAAGWLTGAILLLAACQDTGQAPPARPEPPPVAGEGSASGSLDLVYVCGNKFLVTNASAKQLTVSYRVEGTSESGTLTLAEGPGGDPGASETELETTSGGTVALFQEEVRVARRANEGLACGAPTISAALAVVGSEATAGKWSARFNWPIVALHVHLLRNGKVLSWGKFGDPYVWDPSLKTFTPVPSPFWLFCSGHAFLSDGRLLVNGGHISDLRGLPDAALFDPATLSWTSRPKMSKGRWYPTTTVLANGQAVTLSGTDQNAAAVSLPEVWTGSGWRALTSAGRSLPNYPRTFLRRTASSFTPARIARPPISPRREAARGPMSAIGATAGATTALP